MFIAAYPSGFALLVPELSTFPSASMSTVFIHMPGAASPSGSTFSVSVPVPRLLALSSLSSVSTVFVPMPRLSAPPSVFGVSIPVPGLSALLSVFGVSVLILKFFTPPSLSNVSIPGPGLFFPSFPI